MALTAAQTTDVFHIFGIPQINSGSVINGMLDIFGPALDSYDLTPVKARLTSQLALLAAADETLIIALLARWNVITSTKPVLVHTSGEIKGVLADYSKERQLIRDRLADIVGLSVPRGGFAAEANRLLQQRISR